MANLEHYADVIAPVVERLHDGLQRRVHRATEGVRHQWEVSDAGMRVLKRLQLRRPPEVASWHMIAAAFVYDASSSVMRGVDDLVESALVTTTVEGAVLTPRGVLAIDALEQLTAKAVDELWGAHSPVCLESLSGLLDRVLLAADETGGDSYLLLRPGPGGDSDESDLPLHVARQIMALHAHRFDAHVSTWRSAGLNAREAQLITGGSLHRALRDTTNSHAAGAYGVLNGAERLTLVAGLGALPA